MEKVFVYGTLLDPVIQVRLFSREIFPIAHGLLQGWKKKTDKEFPCLVPDKRAYTQGSILELSEIELAAADQWEEVPHEYQRIKVTVSIDSGGETIAWVYVAATTEP